MTEPSVGVPASSGACPSSVESRSIASWFHTSPRAFHLVVGADLSMARVTPRQQAAACRRRERCRRVHVREADAACCQRVDVGRFDARLAVTAEIAVAGVVHQDEDHVGFAFGRLVARNGRQRGDGCGPQDECAGEGGSFHFGFLFREVFSSLVAFRLQI